MNTEPETIFLILWIGFLLLGVGSAFAFVWWGIRNRQFSDQERARSLPLKSRIVYDDASEGQQEKKVDGDER